MEDRGESFVAVRRISQGFERGNRTCHSTSEVVSGSTTWLGNGLSCVCAQGTDIDARSSFDLTPAQEEYLQRLQSRIDVPYDGSIPEHQDLLQKQEGDRALWEYPFTVTGVDITFMLIQILDIEAIKPRNLVEATFFKFLAENESAFDLLYCITFKLMDRSSVARHARVIYGLQFTKSTRRQIESELLQKNIKRLEDLPSYRLLN